MCERRLLARGYGPALEDEVERCSVARRTRLNPPCLRTSFSRRVPACAPSASSTSWSSERGSGSTAHLLGTRCERHRGPSLNAALLETEHEARRRRTWLRLVAVAAAASRSASRETTASTRESAVSPALLSPLAGPPGRPASSLTVAAAALGAARVAGRVRLRTGPTSGVDTAAAVEPCWVRTPTEWMRQGADEQRGGGGRARARVRLRRSCSRRRPPLRRSAGL
jgi:hypothetical protein